jgi:hypothetical protein
MAQASTIPGDGYMLDGKPYVYTDKAGTAAPAMRDPTTNKWVPDQRAMAQLGMKADKASIYPEDQAALNSLVGGVAPAKNRADAAKDFMDAAQGVPTGPRYGDVPVFGGDAKTAMRRHLAATNPALEAKLEALEAINSTNWPQERPTGSGPIRVIEAQGWKSAFPSITNLGDANQAIAQRDWNTYADKSNEADYVQNYVHSGQGGVPAGQTAFARTKLTPDAAGRHQALGAAPGDFSGFAPGWSQQLPPKQLAAAKVMANPQYAPGDRNNPFVPRSINETRGLPGGAFFIDDDGVRRQMPVARK